jgi:glycosyltransferase involved in cell wall biosynthesis
MVSVVMITYNQEEYIRDAIMGVLNQKVSFDVELIIADDSSPDNTRDIVENIQNNHRSGHWIKYTKHSQNKGMMNNFSWSLKKAKGKYIALCEGDDYWTDPQKLQKQVEFLENYPNHNLCVSGYEKYNVYTKEVYDVITIPEGFKVTENGYSFTLADTKRGWLTKTLTAVFRNDEQVTNYLSSYEFGRDINLFYHILKKGRGFYFTEVTGVYRVHEGGINSMKQGKINKNAAYNVYKELFQINKDEFTRHKFFRAALALFNYDIYHNYDGNNLNKKLRVYFEALRYAKTLKDYSLLLSPFLSQTIKQKLR